MTQQARNLTSVVAERGDEQPRFLIHDRDGKFSRPFDEVFQSEDTVVLHTPIQAPNANAHAERWVRTVRTDCLDRILILGRRQLEHIHEVSTVPDVSDLVERSALRTPRRVLALAMAAGKAGGGSVGDVGKAVLLP